MSAIRFPDHLERQYSARLLRRHRLLRLLVRDRIGAWTHTHVLSAVETVRRAWPMVAPFDPATLMPLATSIDTFATRGIAREVERLTGRKVLEETAQFGVMTPLRQDARPTKRALHQQWALENARLIRGMDEDTLADIAKHVRLTVDGGKTDLERVLVDRFGVAASRARLIARDQVAKLNSRISEEFQVSVGVKSYEWRSRGDTRVRPLHVKLDGTVRSWSDPHPTEVSPGRAICCRCSAVPVI